MAIDLNADVGEIIQQILKKKKGGSPAGKSSSGVKDHLQSLTNSNNRNIVIGYLALTSSMMVFLFAYALPQLTTNNKLEAKFGKIAQKQAQLSTLDSNIKTVISRLTNNHKKHIALVNSFDDEADLDEIYKAISVLAQSNNLQVDVVKKQKNEVHKKHSLLNQTTVLIELSGRFTDYVTFKEHLAKERPLLAISKESVKIRLDEAKSGTLHISMEMATYTVDKSPYKLLNNPEWLEAKYVK